LSHLHESNSSVAAYTFVATPSIMGQGYSLTTLSAGSATIDVPELADLQYEKSLGNARFMKCIRARHKHGLVIAKVVMKPSANKNWDDYVHILSGKNP
jgi:phosphoinositide-3-kinase regulatory subunit 4